MPNFMRTTRFLGVAALAASTALSGPVAALAQDMSTVRVAQADVQLPPDGAAPGAAKADKKARKAERQEKKAADPGAAKKPAAAGSAASDEGRKAKQADRQARKAAEKAATPAASEPAPKPAKAPSAAAEAKPERKAKKVEKAPADAPAAAKAPVKAKPDQAKAPVEAKAPDKAKPAEKAVTKAAKPADATPATAKTASPATPPKAKTDKAAEQKPRDDAGTKDNAAAKTGSAPGKPVLGQTIGKTTPAAPTSPGRTLSPQTETPDGSVAGSNKVPSNAGTAPARGQTVAPLTGRSASSPDASKPKPPVAAAAGKGQAPSAAPTTAKLAVPPRARKPKAVAVDVQNQAVAADGVAASDARVQQLGQTIAVPSVTAVQGERIDNPNRGQRRNGDRSQTRDNGRNDNSGRGGDRRDDNRRNDNGRDRNGRDNARNDGPRGEPQLPPGAKVVDRVGNRDILSIVGAGVAGAVVGGAAGYFIRGNDDERLSTNAEDQYYEQLPERRRRETIVRGNGVKVVTITNRYGDVIQRSKIQPDGREVVLFYDPYQRDDDAPQYYTDPGADLPPIDVTIPQDEYIVAPSEPDEDLYYRTMVAPPVETVERIYSIDEVRRSERIRDKVRRIDLNTIKFDFGSDAIGQSQVPNLEALAEAIAKIVGDNPAETFLIEGHTDAVGTDVANLALSDRRAESVAAALTQYFDVPPENLITQGYGESDLKVDTEGENAENRRVTVRRITALVKPVDTAAN